MLWSLPGTASRPDDYVPLATLDEGEDGGDAQGQL